MIQSVMEGVQSGAYGAAVVIGFVTAFSIGVLVIGTVIGFLGKVF